ncbi:MAG: ArsR family transcriptional regulator [Candidatus Bathyarchaeota archaeon]|nr:ArsR family transcriptional regulator [Candidatus Bathyarchaeota archaeon]
MTEKSHIDVIFSILENPVRRKIIKRLSQQPSYALEIAKELGLGQQLVTTHLSMMERDGFVSSDMKTSPIGPKRRLYFLKQSGCLTVSFGPNMYSEQLRVFDSLPAKLSQDAAKFLDKLKEIQQSASGKLDLLSKLIADIDEKLVSLETEKSVLLHIRNMVMKQASEELAMQEKLPHERRIMHFIIDERCTDVEKISDALNLKESTIRDALKKLLDQDAKK